MPINIGKKDEVFIPGCRTNEDTGTIDCMPKLRKGNVTLEAERPVILRKGTGGDGSPVMEILDDGGANIQLIDKLREYVGKRHL